jgi:hypothetical protein
VPRAPVERHPAAPRADRNDDWHCPAVADPLIIAAAMVGALVET